MFLTTLIKSWLRWLMANIPENTTRWPNVGSRLAQRLRRRASIEPTLGQRIVIAGMGAEQWLSIFRTASLWPVIMVVRHWPNVVPIFIYRLRRWPNIKTTLDQVLVLAGLPVISKWKLCFTNVGVTLASVSDVSPTFNRRWVNVSCLLGAKITNSLTSMRPVPQ